MAKRALPAEMIVLDANILIRAVLGRRVGEILESYSRQGVRFCAPRNAWKEIQEYLPALLRKKEKSVTDLPAALTYLQILVEPVEEEAYAAFESEARARLAGRDDDDWPVLATALAFACPVWTEDTDFFGVGVPVWTTRRIEIYLRSLVENPE